MDKNSKKKDLGGRKTAHGDVILNRPHPHNTHGRRGEEADEGE